VGTRGLTDGEPFAGSRIGFRHEFVTVFDHNGPMTEFDALVVGAGPNGLSAAIELARSGLRVKVVESSDKIGGGTRTEELTLPGFHHDVCSAIHPTALASPFFRDLDLDVTWVHPEIPLTHPLDEGRSVSLFRSVEETAAQLGPDDARYRNLMQPLVESADEIVEDYLSPLTFRPRHFSTFTRFGLLGALPAATLIERFETVEARSLLSGLAAHSIAPFGALGTAGVGLLLAVLAHSHGWPMAGGGSQAIAQALGARLVAMGGVIETGTRIESLDPVPERLVLLDVMPDAAFRIAAPRLTSSTRRRLLGWKPGAGVFKVDWALSGTIPWTDEHSPGAGTVHVGGPYDEVKRAEQDVADGHPAEKPFVLLAQQSLFDDTRAPTGQHTVWGYCHVPNGSEVNMTDAIEAQIERFAPGFKDLILDKSEISSVGFQDYNANYVGGDIGGGKFDLKKVLQIGENRPFALGSGVYLCSAATPPGAGVHGMCGYYAARAALRTS